MDKKKLIYLSPLIIIIGLLYLNIYFSYEIYSHSDIVKYLYRIAEINDEDVINAGGWSRQPLFGNGTNSIYFTLTEDGWRKFSSSASLENEILQQKVYYTINPYPWSKRTILFDPSSENHFYFFSKQFEEYIFLVVKDEKYFIYK